MEKIDRCVRQTRQIEMIEEKIDLYQRDNIDRSDRQMRRTDGIDK